MVHCEILLGAILSDGLILFFAYSSVIPSAVLVSVKTEGGLLLQTEEKIV